MTTRIVVPSTRIDTNECKDIEGFLRLIETCRSRPLLFYDESITGYVIHSAKASKIKTPSTAYLETSIHSGPLEDTIDPISFRPTARDLDEDATLMSVEDSIISSETLNRDSIIYEGEVAGNDYVIWVFKQFMKYPKKKHEDPRVLFSCSVDTKSENKDISFPYHEPNNEFLEDFKAVGPFNILSELKNEMHLPTVNRQSNFKSPGLPVSDPIPVKEELDEVQHFKRKNSIIPNQITKMSIPISVSLIIRIKFTKPAGKNDVLLVTLNLEATEEIVEHFSDYENDHYFEITDLTINYRGGKVDDYSVHELPFAFMLSDSVNLTYKLTNNDFIERDITNPENKNSSSKAMTIKIGLQIKNRDKGSRTWNNVSNMITTNWSPYLDFGITPPPINNSLKLSTGHPQWQSSPSIQSMSPKLLPLKKSAMSSGIIRNRAGPSVVVSGSQSNPSNFATHGLNFKRQRPLTNSTTSSVMVNLTSNTSGSLSGLKLTFQGSLTIKLGEVTEWKLQAINLSSNKLVLSLIAREKVMNKGASLPVNFASDSQLPFIKDINDNVVLYSRSQLYSIYNSLKFPPCGVFILDSDIRIGPLDPNSVFEATIRILGVNKGIYNLDGLRIFDASNGDGLDFGKLVEVFVV